MVADGQKDSPGSGVMVESGGTAMGFLWGEKAHSQIGWWQKPVEMLKTIDEHSRNG